MSPPVVLRRTTEAVAFLRKMALNSTGRAWKDLLQDFEAARDEWSAIEAVVHLEFLLEARGLLMEDETAHASTSCKVDHARPNFQRFAPITVRRRAGSASEKNRRIDWEILRDTVFIYDLFRRIACNASRNSFSACRFLADRQFPRYRAPCSSRVPIKQVAASI